MKSVRNSLHNLDLQATYTAIVRCSVEVFSSFRQPGGFGSNRPREQVNPNATQLRSCSVEQDMLSVLPFKYLTN